MVIIRNQFLDLPSFGGRGRGGTGGNFYRHVLGTRVEDVGRPGQVSFGWGFSLPQNRSTPLFHALSPLPFLVHFIEHQSPGTVGFLFNPKTEQGNELSMAPAEDQFQIVRGDLELLSQKMPKMVLIL